MRVLFLSEALGGHTTVHHNLKVELAAHPDVEATFVDVPPAGLARRVVGAALPGLGVLDLDLQPLRAQLAAAWIARRLLRHHGASADIWHIYTANAALLSSDLMSRHPCLVTTDTTNAHNAYRLPYREPTRFTPVSVAAVKPFERRVLNAADRVVANSEWSAASMRDDYGIAAGHIETLPFGITAPSFDTPAPGPAVTEESGKLPRVTFVGRQLERKGALRLLRLHQQRFRDRFELVLVTTEAVPPGENVTVINDIQPGDGRIWDVLRSSTVFAFPSGIDQAPNAVLEAMGAGVPVIAVDTAAQSEMVLDGVTGLLIEPEDDASLVAALEALLADPERRIAMGAAGRARMLDRYDMSRSTAALLDVMRDVLKTSPKPGLAPTGQ